jgi:hypothetical protein
MSFDALGNPTGTVYPLIGATQPLALTADPVKDALQNPTGTVYDGAVPVGSLLEVTAPGVIGPASDTNAQVIAAVANIPVAGTTTGNLTKFSNTTGLMVDSGVAAANFPVVGTVSGDLVAFSGTTGQYADAGASKGTVGALAIAGVAGGATSPLTLPSQAAAPTGTHQIGEMFVNTAGVWFSCVAGGASPVWSPEFMPNVTGGMSQLLPGGYSFLVCNSFEITLGDTVEIGSGAFLEIT